MSTAQSLTPAEAAYAHLASMPEGTRVAIGGRRFYSEAVITTPQRDGKTLEASCVIATDILHPEVETKVTVRQMLAGRFRIERDEPGWNGIYTDWAAA